MGELSRQTLVVNSGIKRTAEAIYKEAQARELHVSPIVQSGNYACYTIVIVPSGSNYNWDKDTEYRQKVSSFIDWIDSRRSDFAYTDENYLLCEYALINFDKDSEEESMSPQVIRFSS